MGRFGSPVSKTPDVRRKGVSHIFCGPSDFYADPAKCLLVNSTLFARCFIFVTLFSVGRLDREGKKLEEMLERLNFSPF